MLQAVLGTNNHSGISLEQGRRGENVGFKNFVKRYLFNCDVFLKMRCAMIRLVSARDQYLVNQVGVVFIVLHEQV